MPNYQQSQLILYQTDDGSTKLQVKFEGETAWLSQNQMVELFETTKQNISLHIKNIFYEGELERKSVVKEYLTTAAEGKLYLTDVADTEVMLRFTQSIPSPNAEPFKLWSARVEYERLGEPVNEWLRLRVSVTCP